MGEKKTSTRETKKTRQTKRKTAVSFKFNSFEEPDFSYLPDKKKTQYQLGYTPESRDGFYVSREWRALRNHFISEHPICARCETNNGIITRATLVDHIIPIRLDDNLKLDANNLQSLCSKCHTQKTLDDRWLKVENKKLKESFEF